MESLGNEHCQTKDWWDKEREEAPEDQLDNFMALLQTFSDLHCGCAFLQVNLTELKAFPNPPNAVTNVTAAVMVLLAPRGRVPKDRSWKAAKIFMGKVSDGLAR